MKEVQHQIEVNLRNPFKKMMANVKLSSQNPGSTRVITSANKDYVNSLQRELKVNKNGGTYREHKQHFVDITWEDLETQFNKQNGKCYWFGIDIDLNEIFIPYSIQAPSVDRINDSVGYTKDNIVITTRFVNLGRGNYSKEKFTEFIKKLKKTLTHMAI